MAKEQELIELFPKYDTDGDGQINHEEFSNLVTELGLPYIYPGSIKKMFRKMNYENPDKQTINLQQAKEYYSSFQTPSKQDIWKAKYDLLQWAHEVKHHTTMAQQEDLDVVAAPGANSSKDPPETCPQEGNVRILVGPNKPVYSSEIQIEISKSDDGPKVKPFVKLSCKYTSQEKAKEMESVFKANFSQFLKLLAEDIGDWTEEMDNFKINSFVQGSTVTFFITTVNQELVSLIQLFSEMIEMGFGSQFDGNAFIHYEFEYDFQEFFKNETSNFYDLFVKESRFTMKGCARNILKLLRKYVKADANSFMSGDFFQNLFPLVILHLDVLNADLQFDSFQNETSYELQTKTELMEGITEAGQFLKSLEEGGMTIKQLLQLLNCEIVIEANVGQWKSKVFLRLKNLNQLFLHGINSFEQQNKSASSSSAKLIAPMGCKVTSKHQGSDVDSDDIPQIVGKNKGAVVKSISDSSESTTKAKHLKQKQIEVKPAGSPKKIKRINSLGKQSSSSSSSDINHQTDIKQFTNKQTLELKIETKQPEPKSEHTDKSQ